MTSLNDPIHQLFDALWQDYVTRLSPSAPKIHQLISQHDSQIRIQNDHIALRTFSGEKLGLAQLAKHFEALGYVKGGDYDFKAKKLVAHHYQHADLTYPKVFISELVVEQCSMTAQAIIQQLLAQTPDDYAVGSRFLFSGRPWSIS
ncbi:MAG: 2-oxoadipate dioxygenase/decarboxylase family protein, partial [Vibrio sp.]